MNQFMLHCGAQPTDRQHLRVLPPPTPLSDKHHPLPFDTFLDQVDLAMQHHGLTPTNEQFGLSADSKRFFGLIETRSDLADVAPLISLRSSHDQKFSVTVGSGFRALVCDNLSFHSQHVLRTLNTKNVETRVSDKLTRVMGLLLHEFAETAEAFERWKNEAISEAVAYAAITRMIKAAIIPASKAPGVIRIWDAPTHQEYIPGSVYALFQATTEALKPERPLGDPSRFQARTVALSCLCNDLLPETSDGNPSGELGNSKDHGELGNSKDHGELGDEQHDIIEADWEAAEPFAEAA